jgi:hypothetical protein
MIKMKTPDFSDDDVIIIELRKVINKHIRENGGKIHFSDAAEAMWEIFKQHPQSRDALIRAGVDKMVDRATTHLKQKWIKIPDRQTKQPHYTINPERRVYPCPKCGSEDTIFYEFDDEEGSYYIQCDDCGFDFGINTKAGE